jgi:hypothetical protein
MDDYGLVPTFDVDDYNPNEDGIFKFFYQEDKM